MINGHYVPISKARLNHCTIKTTLAFTSRSDLNGPEIAYLARTSKPQHFYSEYLFRKLMLLSLFSALPIHTFPSVLHMWLRTRHMLPSRMWLTLGSVSSSGDFAKVEQLVPISMYGECGPGTYCASVPREISHAWQNFFKRRWLCCFSVCIYMGPLLPTEINLHCDQNMQLQPWFYGGCNYSNPP